MQTNVVGWRVRYGIRRRRDGAGGREAAMVGADRVWGAGLEALDKGTWGLT